MLYLLLILLSAFIGLIVIQLFLSNNENKWIGRFLPIISGIISIIGSIYFVYYFVFSGNVTLRRDGDISRVIRTAIYIFLLYNIPTVVLTTIYAARKVKRNKL